MIRVSQLKLPVEHNEEQFCQKIEKSLKIKKDQIKKLQIVKKSIDARKKPDVSIVYSVDVWVDNEEKILKHSGNKNAVCVKENVEKRLGSGRKMFYISGKQAYWIRRLTCSLVRAVQEHFQMGN